MKDEKAKINLFVNKISLGMADAVFYTGEGLIATVKYKGFSVDVYCDGVTNATLLDQPNGDIVSHLYSPSDFISAGIDTDEAMSMAQEQEILSFANNSWFDLYCEGEHLDVVCHILDDALDSAVTYVEEQYFDEQELMKELDTATID
jgi:hypothetical protein